MLSTSHVGWTFVAVGILLSGYLGWRVRGGLGFVQAIALAFLSGLIGFFLVVAAVLIQGYCAEVAELCPRTTDTTVWSLTYPLAFTPLYWIVSCLSRWARIQATPD
jgi:hypothetical protein